MATMCWCKKFVDEVGVAWSECCDKVKEMGESQDNYKAAMISPSGNRDLKKQLGHEYIKQLITYAETVGPKAVEVDNKIQKVKAKLHVGSASAANKGDHDKAAKRRGSAQGKGKSKAKAMAGP